MLLLYKERKKKYYYFLTVTFVTIIKIEIKKSNIYYSYLNILTIVIMLYFLLLLCLYYIQLNNCEHSNITMEAQLQALNAKNINNR